MIPLTSQNVSDFAEAHIHSYNFSWLTCYFQSSYLQSLDDFLCLDDQTEA